ncbi:MAG: acylphosphatase [Anaerolineales bacterium]|jgi:acylphosphatase
MTDSEKMRLHVIVRGRVQGVGFRAFVVDSGLALGVTGWARNRWDGSVEVVAEGTRDALNTLLADLRRGPRMSNVTELEQEWEPASGEYKSFGIRSTV